jgi:hypothetical protein
MEDLGPGPSPMVTSLKLTTSVNILNSVSFLIRVA